MSCFWLVVLAVVRAQTVGSSVSIAEFLQSNNMLGGPGHDASDPSPSGGDRELLYLFDWSLPLHCPSLADKLNVPAYFANDFLQRTASGSLYAKSWPSLFIGPKGSRSDLHIDAFR